MSVKIALTFWPVAVIASTATSAISEINSAYSSKSCPSSPRTSFCKPMINLTTTPRRVLADAYSCVTPPRRPSQETMRRGDVRPPSLWLSRLKPRTPVLPGDRQELGRDVREDRADVLARRRDREHRDQRHQRDEQRVLQQVLAFVAARERPQTGDEIHDSSSGASSSTRNDVCAICGHALMQRPRDEW